MHHRMVYVGSGDVVEVGEEDVDAEMSHDLDDLGVIEQGFHRRLQHSLFVAHDDIGRAQFDQLLLQD